MNKINPVLGLHHVSVLVADTPRALGFYVDVLGLAPIERPDLGFRGAWLALGAQQLHLMELPNPDSQEGRPEHAGRDRHFALQVSALEPFEQRLKAAGEAFTRSRSGRASIFCRDPDGNGVELMELASNALCSV
ncbi:MAG: VOC family protein [Halothiobacillaceae bacterium]